MLKELKKPYQLGGLRVLSKGTASVEGVGEKTTEGELGVALPSQV